jgi:mono/diheme cytochrome c family protein
MRRRIVVGVWFVAMAVVLAGCGNGDASTTTVTASQTAAVGDSERGRQIWDDGGGVVEGGGCQECHSLDGSEQTAGPFIAPTWQGISGLAGDRVPGLSAEEYLRESIVDPDAYIVEGYSANLMPKGFKFLLSEEDIDDLVAFLLTQ